MRKTRKLDDMGGQTQLHELPFRMPMVPHSKQNLVIKRTSAVPTSNSVQQHPDIIKQAKQIYQRELDHKKRQRDLNPSVSTAPTNFSSQDNSATPTGSLSQVRSRSRLNSILKGANSPNYINQNGQIAPRASSPEEQPQTPSAAKVVDLKAKGTTADCSTTTNKDNQYNGHSYALRSACISSVSTMAGSQESFADTAVVEQLQQTASVGASSVKKPIKRAASSSVSRHPSTQKVAALGNVSVSTSQSKKVRKVKIIQKPRIIGPQMPVCQKRKTNPMPSKFAEFGALIADSVQLSSQVLTLHTKVCDETLDFTQFDESQISRIWSGNMSAAKSSPIGLGSDTTVTSSNGAGNNESNDSKNFCEMGLKFDMNQLETVWDNDTDEEQIKDCRDLLTKELFDVINFFVKNDPLQIVQNLDNKDNQLLAL